MRYGRSQMASSARTRKSKFSWYKSKKARFDSMFSRLLRPNLRAMSTTSSTPVKHRFFVYAPDKTTEGTLDRRLSVRPQHLEAAKQGHNSGFIRVGGMFTTPDAVINPDAPKQMLGSTFIFEAESLEEVKKYIESDIYYTAGVWDPERIVILPFFTAFPL